MFWRSVNLTGNQTYEAVAAWVSQFWRSVNLTGNQTGGCAAMRDIAFWRSVNLTGNQTLFDIGVGFFGFGAVSI